MARQATSASTSRTSRAFNTGAGNATAGASVQSVQLRQPTGMVPIAGTEVTPAVLETLKVTSPELFEDPAVAAKEVKAAATDAVKEESDRAELNRFVDDAAEGAAMHISNDVDFGDQVRLLHELHTTGTVSTGTINRIADQLHMSVPEAVDAINAVNTNTSLQMAALCKAHGVGAQEFASWYKTSDPNAFFKSLQVHGQDRDMVRAWSAPIAAWKARGQR